MNFWAYFDFWVLPIQNWFQLIVLSFCYEAAVYLIFIVSARKIKYDAKYVSPKICP